MEFKISDHSFDIKKKIQTILYEAILNANTENVKIIGDSIVFKGNTFRYTGKKRTLFDHIGKGRISLKMIDQKLEVSYDLEFPQLCLVSFGMALFIFFGGIFIDNKFNSFNIFAFMVSWVWFFGSVLTITLIRLNLFIKRTVLNVIQG